MTRQCMFSLDPLITFMQYIPNGRSHPLIFTTCSCVCFRSFLFSNPEPVQIVPRLLDHVKKPEKVYSDVYLAAHFIRLGGHGICHHTADSPSSLKENKSSADYN